MVLDELDHSNISCYVMLYYSIMMYSIISIRLWRPSSPLLRIRALAPFGAAREQWPACVGNRRLPERTKTHNNIWNNNKTKTKKSAAHRPCHASAPPKGRQARHSERDKWGQHQWGHCKFDVFDGEFLGTPVSLLLSSQTCQGAPFFHNLSKFITFAAAALVLTPFVRNQAKWRGRRQATRREVSVTRRNAMRWKFGNSENPLLGM